MNQDNEDAMTQVNSNYRAALDLEKEKLKKGNTETLQFHAKNTTPSKLTIS